MPTATTTPPQTLGSDLASALIAAYPRLIARTAWTREQVLAHHREQLRSLLRDAVARSPFHAGRLAGIDLDAVDPTDLSALPVMTKADMMASLDDVFTDRRLTRAGVEETLAATGDEPRFMHDRYVAFASGGSSGVRGVHVYDVPGLVAGFLGPLTRDLAARIEAMGGPPPGGVRVAMVAARSAVHSTGCADPLTRGSALPYRYLSVPATEPLPVIVARLEELRPALLFGYPTVLAQIAQHGLSFTPAGVTSASETLTPDLRAIIREGLGAPIVDLYATTEGLTGTSAPDGEEIMLAEDSCIVEVLENRILVTNLGNRVQPLIRYELNDRMTVASDDGLLRVHLEGRADPVLQYGDVAVHPVAIRSELVHTAAVIDYQVRQTARGVDVEVLAPGGVDTEELRARIAHAMATAGLRGPEVSVRAVAGLGRDAETGKLARFLVAR